MSGLALAGGLALYFALQRHFQLPLHHPRGWTGRRLFSHAQDRLFRVAGLFTERIENGSLQRSVALMVMAALAAGAWPFLRAALAGGAALPGAGDRALLPATPLAIVAWLLLLGAGAALVLGHRQHLRAVVLTGAVGLVTSLAFVALSAPDLALTQLSVEVVSTVLLLMGLALLPHSSPRESSVLRQGRDAVLALAGGGGVAWLAWLMMTRDHDSISWFFVDQSMPGGGGSNIVNVILVDFRGYDTFGEVTVLGIAAVGVLALLDGLRARRPAADEAGRAWSFEPPPLMLRVAARIVLPLALLFSAYIFWRGHNLPGGGFIAGLITAVALVLQYMALGQNRADQLLHAAGGLRYTRWVGAGLGIAGLTGLGALASAVLAVAVAAGLVWTAHQLPAGSPPLVYRLGDWPAPYGIVLVADRLAAMMMLLTALLALPVLVYASGGWDGHGRYFHALFQFQLMGLNGAFITGDLFNLFVFFEVLLIASYVLVVHGQGAARFKVGLQYVVLNLAASVLFLLGVALIYGLTGTLNLADLSQRVAWVQGSDAVLLQAAALLLLVVFGFKAALMPLALWMPATYAAASAPVAAFFAVMTKVGVYAILRVHGVVFGAEAGAVALTVQPVLLPLALATSITGVLGALAAHSLPRLVAWLTVSSVGTILAAIGLFNAHAWSAALYYMANSTLVIAGLFLLSELVAAQRGDVADRLVPASAVAQPVLLGLLLLLGAASTAGLPPLPGFIGKLMVLQSAIDHGWAVAVWATVLVVGFFTLVGLSRAGSVLFWAVRDEPHVGAASGASPRMLLATCALFSATVLMSVLAGPIKQYTDATAAQLLDLPTYARAVLTGPDGAAKGITVRPYRGEPGVAR